GHRAGRLGGRVREDGEAAERGIEPTEHGAARVLLDHVGEEQVVAGGDPQRALERDERDGAGDHGRHLHRGQKRDGRGGDRGRGTAGLVRRTGARQREQDREQRPDQGPNEERSASVHGRPSKHAPAFLATVAGRGLASAMRFLLVCLGGAAGTGARYLLGGWAQRAWGVGFPYGTLIINAVGSFLLVMVMYFSLERGALSADARVVLGTGVMGGFTTYSTFNYETFRLIQQGSFAVAGLYLAATVVGCLGAGALGLVLARAFGRDRPGRRPSSLDPSARIIRLVEGQEVEDEEDVGVERGDGGPGMAGDGVHGLRPAAAATSFRADPGRQTAGDDPDPVAKRSEPADQPHRRVDRQRRRPVDGDRRFGGREGGGGAGRDGGGRGRRGQPAGGYRRAARTNSRRRRAAGVDSRAPPGRREEPVRPRHGQEPERRHHLVGLGAERSSGQTGGGDRARHRGRLRRREQPDDRAARTIARITVTIPASTGAGPRHPSSARW